MIDTRSQQAQLTELDRIEQNLKKARDEFALQRVCVELNKFRDRYSPREMDLPARARYSVIRGVMYTRVGLLRQPRFLGSSVECLLYALDEFEDAKEALERYVKETGCLHLPLRLLPLQQLGAYETMVVTTRLKVWGNPVKELAELAPELNCLNPDQRRKALRAYNAPFALTSSFR